MQIQIQILIILSSNWKILIMLSPDWSIPTDGAKEEEMGMVRHGSPATQQFVEDSLARGFPLIPFLYTSLDIVERGRARHRNKEMSENEIELFE